ncbi:MAG: sensor histidine kinase, partial [Candidatus Binatia bacterium]
MWVSDRYFLRAPNEQRESVLHQYIVQIEAFRARPTFEASLRTAKEQAERAARAATDAMEKAVAANRAKSEFLANMSHELRTPLNAIIGFSDLICHQSLGPDRMEKYLEYARDIRNSGEHLLEVINDILDLAKIEFGKATLQEEDCEIDNLVQACFRIVHERAVEGGLALVYEAPQQRPLLYADTRKVKQILLNLLSNSLKFTPDGGRVALTVERT